MDNKEMAERFRNAAEYLNKARTDMLNKANELDPPNPEPGTVVWWRFYDPVPSRGWEYGVVGVSKNGVWTSDGLVKWDRIEYKPARILGPGEVSVKVPPVSKWPDDSGYCEIVITFARHENYKRVQRVIVRDEARSMEAEHGE